MKLEWYKVATLAAGILGGALLTGGHAHAAEASDVKVQVNDQLVQFAEAYPYIDQSSKLKAPLRAVSDNLGLKLAWWMDGSKMRIRVMSAQHTAEFAIGDQVALVDGKTVQMGTDFSLINGNTCVPVRFLSETFGIRVQWDQNNGIAILDADGKYHAPAWYAPVRTAASLISTANDYIGIPYVWGGESPQGFDCSGFVQYVFRQYGIDLPRTAKEMYEAGGSVSDLQAGDLVFFNTRGPLSHVGIYIGNDQFISATSSKGIQIQSLGSGYWGSRYIGAKRVL